VSTFELLLRLAGGALLIGANAFFVAVEFALTRLRGLDLDPDEVSSGGLETAWELTERLEIHLTGCQLGISSTSVVLGIVAEPGVTHLIEPVVGLVGVEGTAVRGVSVVVAVVILNLVHKIWGEQAPTYLGVERPEQVARRLAPVLKVWSTVMMPFIKLGDGIAKWTLGLFGVEITRSWQEAEAEAPEAGHEGPPANRSELTERIAHLLSSEVVPEDRGEEILQALRIDEIEAREIMVPADRVAWLAMDEASRAWCERIGEEGFMRYPVLERRRAGEDRVRQGEVAGTLYVPALFRRGPEPCTGEGRDDGSEERRKLLADAVYLPSDTPVSRLIDALQEEGQEMSLLVEPDDRRSSDGGEVVGLVTVSDAFEAIAGDLTDPLDDDQPG
jgi:CBS domain containing-hemolysin-like protein